MRHWVWKWIAGRAVADDLERHRRAADALDRAVREALRA